MTKRVKDCENLKKITIWIDPTQWELYGKVVGQKKRSDKIRKVIDKSIARAHNKGVFGCQCE